jgi:hypothetical protein
VEGSENKGEKEKEWGWGERGEESMRRLVRKTKVERGRGESG